MTAYVIYDVEILDPIRYEEFRDLVWRAVEDAGGRYLVRDGALKVYEGEWKPRDFVILQFPSVAAWESFYYGPAYQGLKAIRDTCSAARLVSVEGLEEPAPDVGRSTPAELEAA